ncbi:MAG: hypothetical protein HW414_1719 [Dehalococcoidia bacterium]|nr:hypothetical protein [Dehalococcoidia bacterium]
MSFQQQPVKPRFFYGWLIAVVAMLTLAVAYGVRYSFSVFYVEILDAFHWGRPQTAAIFSVNVIVYGAMVPVAGALVDRFGPRRVLPLATLLLALGTAALSQATALWHFYFLYGFVVAISIASVGFVPFAAILSNWFIQKRGAAFGILSAGFGISYFSALFSDYLISTLSWRGAYLVIAGIVLAVILPLVILFARHRPEDMGLLPDGMERQALAARSASQRVTTTVTDKEWASRNWSLLRAFRTYRFWMLFGASFCFIGVALNLMLAHQVAFAVEAGFSRTFGAFIYSLFGLAYLVGNLCGFVSDRLGREKTVSLGCAGGMAAIVLMTFVQDTSHPWILYLYALLFGLGMGIASPALTSSAADLFHGKSFGAINGVIIMAFGIGAAFAAWFAAYLFELTGTYLSALYTVMGGLVAACAFEWLAAPRKVRKTGK